MTSKFVVAALLSLVLMLNVPLAASEPWTVFDAVQRTLSTHPQFEVAQTILDEARGENRSSLSLPPPTLTARYDNIPLGQRLSQYEENRLGITQDFDFPLMYVWRSKWARSNSDEARHRSRTILLDLESEVRLAYLEAWLASEKVKILEEHTAAIQIFATEVQETAQLGEVSQFDARRAVLQARQAENELQTLQHSKIIALGKLARLTNFDIAAVELASPLESDPVDTARLAASDALASNPEALIAAADVGILSQEKKLACYSWLPDLELFYYQELRRFDDDPDTWGIQLELSLPLWFWWGGLGDVQASKARLKRRQADLEAYRLELSFGWFQLSQELKSAVEQYTYYQKVLLPMTQDVYKRAQMLYRIRQADFLDVIRAQNNLKDVQLELIELASDIYDNKIKLDRLAGFSIVAAFDRSE